MALSNPVFDDDMRSNNDVDPPNSEESIDGELVNDDRIQTVSEPTEIDLSNETILSSVRELLECPVCLNRMYPPIHQCSNGHTICPRCKPRVHNRCPTCRRKLGNIRCLALEKVAASFALPCKYISVHIQAEIHDEVQAEIQAEVSKNWPMQEDKAQDAGSFDQAPSWKQGLEDRIVHRIAQRIENKIVSEMAKLTDEMDKIALAKVEDEMKKMKDDLVKIILAKVKDEMKDHLFAQLSVPPPPHHP